MSLPSFLDWYFLLTHLPSSERRVPEEKGPFGKSTSLRGLSRSRTYTPARKEDQAKLDNLRATDEFFNKWKAGLREKNKTSDDTRDNALVAIDPNVAPNPQASAIQREPTEVILYGFGTETQWAAIAFYEKASLGIIYEDYDRTPPTTHFDHTFANSASRAASLSRLSQAALRKKNTWVGGAHWIKVTFDSPEAAENACRTSPHKVCGYVVYAERYRGIGPDQDAPIFATTSGEIVGNESPPNSQSTHTMSSALPESAGSSLSSPLSSSATASSATATVTTSSAPEQVSYPNLRRTSSSTRRRHPLTQIQNADEPAESSEGQPGLNGLGRPAVLPANNTPSTRNMRARSRRDETQPSPPNSPTRELGPGPNPPAPADPHTPLPRRTKGDPGTLRVRGARTIAFAPATSAVLPTQPGWKLFLAALPLLGVIFSVLLGVPPDAVDGSGGKGGGGSFDVIGNQVPRREDGGFDWEGASVWWRVCWWLDRWLWTDLCGMKGED